MQCQPTALMPEPSGLCSQPHICNHSWKASQPSLLLQVCVVCSPHRGLCMDRANSLAHPARQPATCPVHAGPDICLQQQRRCDLCHGGGRGGERDGGAVSCGGDGSDRTAAGRAEDRVLALCVQQLHQWRRQLAAAGPDRSLQGLRAPHAVCSGCLQGQAVDCDVLDGTVGI